jgi:hypothetical protein
MPLSRRGVKLKRSDVSDAIQPALPSSRAEENTWHNSEWFHKTTVIKDRRRRIHLHGPRVLAKRRCSPAQRASQVWCAAAMLQRGDQPSGSMSQALLAAAEQDQATQQQGWPQLDLHRFR